MKKRKIIIRKTISFISGLLLVLQSIVPSALFITQAHAQAVTPTEIVSPTPQPTADQPLVETPTIAPTITETPTPTEEVTPNPEPTIITPTSTEVTQPTETGPPEEGQIGSDGASTTATPNETEVTVAESSASIATPVEKVYATEGQQFNDSTNEYWNIDLEKGVSETKGKVELGVKYIFPQENKVTVTFTALPKDERLRTSLKIQKVKVSDLNLPDNVKPYGEYAYDITTTMANGTFEYDVTLPKPENQAVEVSYMEDQNGEVKAVEGEKLAQEGDKVKVNNLNHFTIFVVTSPVQTGLLGGCTVEVTEASVSDKCFNTIQAAIDAVTTGDETITIAAGTYTEALIISGKTNLTIQGAGDTTIIEPSYVINTAAIMIKHSDGLTIKNLKIHTSGDEQQGIWVKGAFYDNDLAVTGLKIQNTTIEVDAASGIVADASTDAAHSGWLITGNRITSSAVAMSIQDLTNSTISSNTLTAGTGTNVLWTSERHNLANLVFTDNIVSGSGGSQVSILTDYNQLESNVAAEDPVVNTFITGVTVHGNTFSNWGSPGAGRALRIGTADGTGNVTGAVITSNTFQMTVDKPEVIGGTATGTTGSGNIFNVSGTAKIQIAIDAAFAGDTVNVAAGTYNENQILINKPLTIQGAGIDSSIIDGGRATTLTGEGLVRITAPGDVVFSGFTLRNVGVDQTITNAQDDMPVRVGIYASSPSGTYTISNNKIIGTGNPDDAEDYGLYASGGNENIVFSGNTITGTGANAILVENHEGSTDINANTLDEGVYGSTAVFVMTSGIDVTTLQNITSNTINVGTGNFNDDSWTSGGITFSSAYGGTTGTFTNVQISDNTITNLLANRRGISLWNASSDGLGGKFTSPKIFGNTITGTDPTLGNIYGIKLTGLTEGAQIYDNTISGIKYGAEDLDGANNFDNGTNRGNSWSDYTGVDVNGDGIGETPYVIDADSRDRYPKTTNILITPVITSPSNNTYTTTSGLVKIDWNNVSATFTPVIYQYQAFSDANYTSSIYLSAWLSSSEIPTPGTLEGTYYIRVKAKDTNNNETVWSNGVTNPYKITVDNTPPSVPMGIYYRDTVNNKDIACGQKTNTKHLDVYWNANTEPDFDHYEYVSFNADGSAGPIRTFTTNYFNASWWTIPTEGTYGVQIKAVDKAGNKSDWFGGSQGVGNSCKYIVDWTAPTKPAFTAPENNLFTKINSVTLTWSGGDDTGTTQSGIKGYTIRYTFVPMGGGATANWSSGLIANGNPKTHSGSYGHGQGTYTLYVSTTDNAGNISPESNLLVLTYDATVPSTPSATPVAGDYTSDQSVTLTSSDSGSGLAAIYYTIDGSTPNNTKTHYAGAITVNHDMTIKAIAYDNAGNVSGVLEAIYKIAPTISLETEAAIGDTTATITWTTDDLATSRVIYDTVSHPDLGAAPNYDYANSTIETDNDPKVTSHSVGLTGLTSGTTYYYRVVSHGSPEAVGPEQSFTTTTPSSSSSNNTSSGGGSVSGATAPVCSDSKPGSAPTLLSAVAAANSVTLTWTEATTPVTYYLITYGTGPGLQQFGNPNVGGAGTTSYTVTGLSGGSTYYFKVRAGNGCMPGDYSNELSATPGGGFVESPATGFQAGVLGATTEVTPTATPTPTGEISGAILGLNNTVTTPWTWWIFILGGLLLIIIAIYFYYRQRKNL